MAPEVLGNETSNEKCDVFSFGEILRELMTRSIPWNHLIPLQDQKVVGIVRFMDRRLDIPEDVDPWISAIIRDCWNSDPDRRLSFTEMLKTMMGLLRGNTTSTLSAKG